MNRLWEKYQDINTLISNSCKSCKGKVGFGWAESVETEVVLFIDNSVTDIASYTKMIESIGGKMTVFNFPDSPARIEITFHKIQGVVNLALSSFQTSRP